MTLNEDDLRTLRVALDIAHEHVSLYKERAKSYRDEAELEDAVWSLGIIETALDIVGDENAID